MISKNPLFYGGHFLDNKYKKVGWKCQLFPQFQYFCSKISIMYYQIREDTFYIMLYTVVAMLSLIASCYLLFRQGNAFARDVTPPLRLRRWVAAFFASMTLSHVWYLPTFYLTSVEDIKMVYYTGALFDFMMVFPLAIAIMLVMLQNRRHPLWPIALMIAPIVVAYRNSAKTNKYC